MAVPSYIAAAALGSSTGSVGPTAGINTTGATALRVVVITQQSGTPSVTDSRSNTWTTDRAAVLLNGTFTAYVHFFKATTNNVGTAHTFSATGATATSIWAIAVGPSAGGSLTLTAFDAVADASSPYTSNSITPASADALLIAFGASDGAGSPVTTTWQNGETARADVTDHNNFWGGSVATRAVTSSGSYAASFTDNSTSPANSVVAILAVTESGGPTTESRTLTSAGIGAASFQSALTNAQTVTSAGVGAFSPAARAIIPQTVSSAGVAAANFAGSDANTPTIEARTVTAAGVAAAQFVGINSSPAAERLGGWAKFRRYDSRDDEEETEPTDETPVVVAEAPRPRIKGRIRIADVAARIAEQQQADADAIERQAVERARRKRRQQQEEELLLL